MFVFISVIFLNNLLKVGITKSKNNEKVTLKFKNTFNLNNNLIY